MKYFAIKVSGPHFFYDAKPLTFNDVASDEPFECSGSYYERGYFCLDDVKIVLEEYGEDQKTIVSSKELVDNGVAVEKVSITQNGTVELSPARKYPMKWWYDDDVREFKPQYFEEEEIDASKIEIRVSDICFPGRGVLKVIDTISYDGYEAEMDQLSTNEKSCWCEYEGRIIKLVEGESIANQLVKIGYVAKRVASYQAKSDCYVVGHDECDKNAKFICVGNERPNDDGTYKCCVVGHSDEMLEFEPNSYDTSEMKESIYNYNPITGSLC